jgi:hypothetical protein
VRHAVPLGLTGYTARVSRGGNKIFGTPSEVNLLALTRLMEEPTTPAEAITDAFVRTRYGVDPTTAPGRALAQAIELSFDIGRKMYYFLGFWALEKSSGLPDSLRETALLVGRSIAKYDADYVEVFASLSEPSVQTLVDLRQEKNEALALAAVARGHIETAAPALTETDAADLRRRFRHQELCTAVWREVAEVVWAYKLQRQGRANASDDVTGWIDAGLAGLEGWADVIERELPANAQYPCPAAEVRALAADLRADYPAEGGKAREQAALSPPTITVAGTVAVVEVDSDVPLSLTLQYGTKLPLYDNGGVVAPTVPGPARSHRFQLPPLPADSWWVVRAIAAGGGPNGTDLVGADWWVALRSTFVREGRSDTNSTMLSLF